MKQYVELGLCVAALSGIGAVLLQDWELVYQFSGIIGFIAITLALVLFVTVRREKLKEEPPQKRKQFATALLSFGLPNIIAAAVAFFIK